MAVPRGRSSQFLRSRTIMTSIPGRSVPGQPGQKIRPGRTNDTEQGAFKISEDGPERRQFIEFFMDRRQLLSNCAVTESACLYFCLLSHFCNEAAELSLRSLWSKTLPRLRLDSFVNKKADSRNRGYRDCYFLYVPGIRGFSGNKWLMSDFISRA